MVEAARPTSPNVVEEPPRVAILVNAVDGLLARWISIPLAVDRLVQSRRVALLLIAVARREDGAAGARSEPAPTAAGQRTRREASVYTEPGINIGFIYLLLIEQHCRPAVVPG